ncbi:hypothetical protein [Lacrimispora sp.]|uniref:hypothetical protein n=1 Tax=Lacrimispora sp. TaxID=2719234 RepID=UPI0028A2212E|nr:hypothetical protein [Lacrimispora sp.]
MMEKEELYVWYQTELNRLEEEREIYEREAGRFEEEKELTRAESGRDRGYVERLIASWGECQESGSMRSEFEESVEEEYRELRRQEEALAEKHLHIWKETACCEEQYEEELRKFVEEEC